MSTENIGIIIIGLAILWQGYYLRRSQLALKKKMSKFDDRNITFKNGISYEKKHYPQQQADDDYVSEILETNKKGQNNEQNNNHKEVKGTV